MYKKIIIICIVFLPMFYSLVIGYPIISTNDFYRRSKSNTSLQFSKRCYKIGDLSEYIRCVVKSEKLQGLRFFSTVSTELSKMNPGFHVAFFTFLTLQIVTSILVIFFFL